MRYMRHRPGAAAIMDVLRHAQPAPVAGLPPAASPAAGMRLRQASGPISELSGDIEVPSSVQLLLAWIIGGGGGGGVAAVSTSLTPTFGFGGGGGSAGNEAWLWIVRPAQYGITTISWALGDGGAAGVAGGSSTLTLLGSSALTVAGGQPGNDASSSGRGLGGRTNHDASPLTLPPGADAADFQLLSVAGTFGGNGEAHPSPATPPATGGRGGSSSMGRSGATLWHAGMGGGGHGQDVGDVTWNGAGNGGGLLIFW